MSIPRQYAFVKFDYKDLPKGYHEEYPFREFQQYIFLGEIPNMKGHCIVMNTRGKMFVGYHTENFIEIPEDEVITDDKEGY